MKEAEGKFRSGSDGKRGFGNAETALSPGSQKNIDPSSKFPVNSKRNILLFHALNGFTVSRSAIQQSDDPVFPLAATSAPCVSQFWNIFEP